VSIRLKKNLRKKIDISVPKIDPIQEVVTTGTPMGVEHFGIKDWAERLLNPTLDHNGLVQKISFIEEFAKEKMNDEQLKENKDNYSSIIHNFENYLGISDTYEPDVRVNKIFNLLKLIERESLEKSRKSSIFMLLNQNK
jgi:hypothetical protein